MAITLHDLARACACNVSTVSRALRGDPRISPEVRARITDEAARQGYRPNLTARSLVSGRSGTIWFLVGSLESPTDHQPAEAAARLCQEHGRDLLVATHHGDPAAHHRLLGRLRQGLADGAIIAATALDQEAPELRELAASGFPLVFIDRHVPGIVAPMATTDHQECSSRIVAALQSSGITHVVNLHPHGHNPVEDARRRSVDRAVAAAGMIPVPNNHAVPHPVGVVATGWAMVEQWRTTVGALPRGSVVAIYDRLTGDPPMGCGLIIVEQDFTAMATAAWQLLADRLAGAPAGRTCRLIAPRTLHVLAPPSSPS